MLEGKRINMAPVVGMASFVERPPGVSISSQAYERMAKSMAA